MIIIEQCIFKNTAWLSKHGHRVNGINGYGKVISKLKSIFKHFLSFDSLFLWSFMVFVFVHLGEKSRFESYLSYSSLLSPNLCVYCWLSDTGTVTTFSVRLRGLFHQNRIEFRPNVHSTRELTPWFLKFVATFLVHEQIYREIEKDPYFLRPDIIEDWDFFPPNNSK